MSMVGTVIPPFRCRWSVQSSPLSDVDGRYSHPPFPVVDGRYSHPPFSDVNALAIPTIEKYYFTTNVRSENFRRPKSSKKKYVGNHLGRQGKSKVGNKFSVEIWEHVPSYVYVRHCLYGILGIRNRRSLVRIPARLRGVKNYFALTL
jgi:hypothetical protein